MMVHIKRLRRSSPEKPVHIWIKEQDIDGTDIIIKL